MKLRIFTFLAVAAVGVLVGMNLAPAAPATSAADQPVVITRAMLGEILCLTVSDEARLYHYDAARDTVVITSQTGGSDTLDQLVPTTSPDAGKTYRQVVRASAMRDFGRVRPMFEKYVSDKFKVEFVSM